MKHPDLYILRHGQTRWNLEGKFQGRKDSLLTDKGKAQALAQRAILERISNLPSQKFSSPQGRAMDTARLVFGTCDEVVFDDRLKEINFGDWEGATRDQIKSEIDYSFEEKTWKFRSPKGESFAMISKRVRGFLKDLNDPAVIVTHGVTSIVLRGICIGLNQTELLKLPLDQGCVFHLSNGAEEILR